MNLRNYLPQRAQLMKSLSTDPISAYGNSIRLVSFLYIKLNILFIGLILIHELQYCFYGENF
jgi:hypothetical protein